MKISHLLEVLVLSLSTIKAANVVNLNEDDFLPYIDENPHVIVKYCSPLYSKCEEIQSEYEKAAENLKDANIKFAQVDCSLEQGLCLYNGVDKYPKFQLHRDGNVLEYRYKEDNAENIELFVKSFIAPPMIEVNSESLETLNKENEKVILTFLESSDSEEYQSLFKVSNALRDEYKFAFSFDKELAKKYNAGFPSNIFIKNFSNENPDVQEGSFDEVKLLKFIKMANLPLMGDLSSKNYDDYLIVELPLLYFFVDDDKQKETIGKNIEEIAKNYRLKMNFIYVDAKKYGEQAETLGIEQKWPSILIQDPKTKLKYAFDNEEFEKENIQKFINDYFDGKVKSFYKSEELEPQKPGDYLIKLNSYNFEKVVLDMKKDVFVLFYADYCKPCRETIPVLREIADEIEEKDLVQVAYMDAVKNDIPGKSPFDKIDGFPTLVLFRANRKNEPILFPTNDYFKEDYIDFITQYAINDVTFEKKEKESEEKETKEEKKETKEEEKENKDEL